MRNRKQTDTLIQRKNNLVSKDLASAVNWQIAYKLINNKWYPKFSLRLGLLVLVDLLYYLFSPARFFFVLKNLFYLFLSLWCLARDTINLRYLYNRYQTNYRSITNNKIGVAKQPKPNKCNTKSDDENSCFVRVQISVLKYLSDVNRQIQPDVGYIERSHGRK